MIVVELRCAVHRLLRADRRSQRREDGGENHSPHDGLLSSLMVMRHSVRGSFGSVSVAECSNDALSQITTSPTPYFRLIWYFGWVAWRLSSSSRPRASSSGMPSMPNELPDTA